MMLIRCAVIAVSFGFLAGCSSQPRGQIPGGLSTLQDVNDLLHSAAKGGRVPGKLDDLDRLQSMYPRGYAAVKSGDVVVL
jgi:hypothetical protein